MSSKVKVCKSCSQEFAKNAKFCPHCGAKNKKPIFKKWWFWVIIALLFIVIGSSGDDTDSENVANNTDSIASESTDNATSKIDKTETPTKTEYYVGDILEDGNMKIVFMSSGDYTEENEFMQPADGKKYIYCSLRLKIPLITRTLRYLFIVLSAMPTAMLQKCIMVEMMTCLQHFPPDAQPLVISILKFL